MLNIDFDKKAIDKKIRESLPSSFEHKWHNRFHLEMPFGLINDPNGLCYVNGEYHVFYQWNPFGCEHKNKCWGHVKTADFVNYTMPEISMWPSDEYDKNGCYSGSGFAEDGKVRLLYTNNAKDEAGNRLATQRIATLQADGSVSKDAIVVDGPAEGFTPHYRDPYYFCKDDKEYFVLGAQRENETGTVVMYQRDKESAETEKWDFLGEIKTGSKFENFGYMWECPGMLELTDEADKIKKDIMLFCPQGLEAEEYRYQNQHQSGYVVGSLDVENMTMNHGEFEELDKGFDFYAPQILNRNGRAILFGWMGMPDKDDECTSREAGWMYSLTMPRELSLKDGHVYSAPVNELKALRRGTAIEKNGLGRISACLPRTSEVEVNVSKEDDVQNTVAEISFTDEKLVFTYDWENQVMTIDRSKMKLGGGDVRRFKLPANDGLNMKFYIDKGSIEVFFQNGYTAASMLIFPQEDVSPCLKVCSQGASASINAEIHELGGYSYK